MSEHVGTIQGISVIVGFIIWLGWLAYGASKAKAKQDKAARLIDEWLGDRDRKAVIEASPYSYAQQEGKDGYRIMDERMETPYIGRVKSAEQAEKEILARILSEEG